MANPTWGQIFSDDFEVGTVGNAITTIANGGVWGRVGGGADTPKYASAGNPFLSGSQYADVFAPTLAASTSLVSSDTADTDMKKQFIAGHVTTWSFNFYEPGDFAGTLGHNLGYTWADDINTAESTWRAFMLDGVLTPDQPNEGAAINYAVNTVHTLFMMANDTATAVVNYQPGQTLDPGDADVWLSLNGAAPVFAFALNRLNAAQAPQGVGFRSLSDRSERIWIDDVLIVDGATFDRENFEPPPSLELLVDRSNGQVRIENNTDESMSFTAYQIASIADSLNEGGWNPISNQSIPGFPVGNGSGNGWESGPDSDNGDLREYYLQGMSTLDPGEFISLGQAYNTSVDAADLVFHYAEDGNPNQQTGPVEYGTIPVVGLPGDYNVDNIVDAADYTVWRNNLGDLDETDLHNNGNGGGVTEDDYTWWKQHYGNSAMGGGGSLAQNAVPEPATCSMLLAGMLVKWLIRCRGEC